MNDLDQRIARLERALSAARWRTIAIAIVSAGVATVACKQATPNSIQAGNVILDDTGLHIKSQGHDVRLDQNGLSVAGGGETKITADSIEARSGDSEVLVMLHDRPQLTLKKKGNSVDLVAWDDHASVSVVGPSSTDLNTLSSTTAAKK